MSVTTKTDELVDQMNEDISKAAKSTHAAFTGIFVDKAWGHDEYKPEFKEKLRKVHATMMELQDLLDN